jgi:hypothetical protein
MHSSHQPVPEGTHAVADAPTQQTKGLLEEHVPLSLIMDLTAPGGPASREILAAEGAPEHAWWVRD